LDNRSGGLLMVSEVTGDHVIRDNHDCFWFVGRKDDVIKSSGYPSDLARSKTPCWNIRVRYRIAQNYQRQDPSVRAASTSIGLMHNRNKFLHKPFMIPHPRAISQY
jgi:hypothetical protein